MRSVVEMLETEASAEESGPRFERPSTAPGRGDYEVGVAADRAREVGIVALVQAIVAKGFRRISGAFQALEEPQLDRIFLRLAANGRAQSLELRAVGQTPASDAMKQRGFAKLGELFGIGLLVNALEGRLPALHEFACNEFIGQQHQLLDQLVGNVVFDLLEPQCPALSVQPDLHLGKFKIQRTRGKALATQERRQFPRDGACASRLSWGRLNGRRPLCR